MYALNYFSIQVETNINVVEIHFLHGIKLLVANWMWAMQAQSPGLHQLTWLLKALVIVFLEFAVIMSLDSLDPLRTMPAVLMHSLK